MEQAPNEYFLKKEQKEMEERAMNRRRFVRKMMWRAVIVLVVAGGVYGIFWLINQFRTASLPPVGQYFPAQSRNHIGVGAEHPPYNSNPPTGGWHYDNPAQTGIYDTQFADEQIIHNLEHGHVWIAYKPDLPADQIEKLADIAKSYGSKIIMAPRPANDSAIAIAVWQYLLKLDSVDETLIRQFIAAHRGIAGPESIPDFGFKDFRKK